MLAALAGRPSLHRGVAVVDPSIADAQLGRMHALGVRGIRFNLVSPVGNGPQELDALSRACANGAGTCCGKPMPRISKASRDGTSAAAWAACSTTWQACTRNCRRRMRPGSTWTAWPASKLSRWYRLRAQAPYTALCAHIERVAQRIVELELAAHRLRAGPAAGLRQRVGSGRGSDWHRGRRGGAAAGGGAVRLRALLTSSQASLVSGCHLSIGD